ncbi:MAG: hypothetical protein ACR2O1_01470 [Boseongicola sp.]
MPLTVGMISGAVVATLIYVLMRTGGVTRYVARFSAALGGMAVILGFYWFDPKLVLE